VIQRIGTALPEVFLVEPRVFRDSRGDFSETFSAREFERLGVSQCFVQDNQSCSRQGVLRGLHYQLGRPQAKLIRVIRGVVFDVAVDVRRGSPNFGCWAGQILSEENQRILFIPEGFAHGFYVLSDLAVCIYKCSDYYAPDEERGIIWNDPTAAIAWPIPPALVPILSGKDRLYPRLQDVSPEDLPIYSSAPLRG
jgi:dTDP-4-dehydrorhamnose 3,5-epimerase